MFIQCQTMHTLSCGVFILEKYYFEISRNIRASRMNFQVAHTRSIWSQALCTPRTQHLATYHHVISHDDCRENQRDSRQLFCEFETIETTNDQMKRSVPFAFQSKVFLSFSLKSPYSNISVFVLHRMDYYLNIRDIQTLGMLSCVLAHHALSDDFKPPRNSFNTEVIPSSMSFPFGSPPSFNNDSLSQVIFSALASYVFEPRTETASEHFAY